MAQAFKFPTEAVTARRAAPPFGASRWRTAFWDRRFQPVRSKPDRLREYGSAPGSPQACKIRLPRSRFPIRAILTEVSQSGPVWQKFPRRRLEHGDQEPAVNATATVSRGTISGLLRYLLFNRVTRNRAKSQIPRMAVLHPPCPVSAASLDLPGTTITSQLSSKAQAQFNVLFIRTVRIGGRASRSTLCRRTPASVRPQACCHIVRATSTNS